MVRIARWTLLLLAATCAAAQDQPAANDAVTPQTCIAPEVVTGFEQKIRALESSNADAAAQLATVSNEWTSEKKSLVAQLETEQAAHRSTATLLRNANAKAGEAIALLEKKIDALEATVASVKSELAAQKEVVATRDSDAKAAREKLQQYAAKVKALENDVQQSRKSNDALRTALESKEETEISLSALLSSYYDEGVVVAASTVAALREQAEQSSDTLTKVVDTLESTKKTVVDSTDKFYSANLAATVDPILADIRSAADPHVQKYLPLVQTEAERAKTEALKLSHEGLARAKSARLDAIAVLEQNEHVRSHAQKIVDGVLIAVAVPLALLQFRMLLRFAWWLFTSAVCVLTCGCCCSRKRPKRKASLTAASRKAAALETASMAAGATGNNASQQQQQKKKSTTTTTTTATKRSSSGKKNNR